MNKTRLNNGLVITGGVLGTLLLGTTYYHFNRKQQDKIASLLLQELTKTLNLSTKGLIGEIALDPHFHQEVFKKVSKTVVRMSKKQASELADKIYNAFDAWFVGSKEKKIVLGVLRNLKDKVRVSQVALAYEDNKYGSLRDALQENFDEAEIKTVMDMLRALPSYRTV